MIKLNWAEIKNQSDIRKIGIHYIERSNYYKVYLIDGNFQAEANIIKTTPANTDQTDFETNYKTSNQTNIQPIQQVSLTLSEDGLKLSGDAISFIAAANTTTTSDFLFDKAYLFRGVSFMSPNAAFGDYIKAELIDIDNVLGLGANTILATPIKKAFIQTTSNPVIAEDISAAELPVAGLYLRISYTNTALLNGVNVYINLKLYERN